MLAAESGATNCRGRQAPTIRKAPCAGAITGRAAATPPSDTISSSRNTNTSGSAVRHQVLLPALILFGGWTVANASQTATMDLVCKGQVVDAAGTSKPFVTQISIDLNAKRWCDRRVGCPYVFPILGRRGDDLQLLAVKTPLNEAAFDIDLKTGAFSRKTRIPDRPDSPTSAVGVCTPAAFTPFN